MKPTSLLFSRLFILLLFVACKKEESKGPETDGPSVISFTINESAYDVQIKPGTELRIDGEFLDNQSLDSVRVSISASSPTSKTWSYEQGTSYPAGGSKHRFIHWKETVPSTVEQGEYIAELVVYDTDGNEVRRTVRFRIESVGPEITLNVKDDVKVGDTLRLFGNVTAAVDLKAVNIKLSAPDYTAHPTIYDENLLVPGSSDTSWDFQSDGQVNIYIPVNSVRFEYKLAVTAVNSAGDISFEIRDVMVRP